MTSDDQESGDDPGDGHADGEPDEAEVGAIRRMLDGLTAPDIPVVTPWKISVVGLVQRSYNVPRVAAKALGQLDRFGALRITSTSLGIDDDDIDWGKITCIRTATLAEAFGDNVVDAEIKRLTGLLPKLLPGRSWIARKVAAVLKVAARSALTKAPGQAAQRTVVTGIDYRRSLGRTGTLAAGLVVTSVLGSVPGANDAVIHMATTVGQARIEGPGSR